MRQFPWSSPSYPTELAEGPAFRASEIPQGVQLIAMLVPTVIAGILFRRQLFWSYLGAAFIGGEGAILAYALHFVLIFPVGFTTILVAIERSHEVDRWPRGY